MIRRPTLLLLALAACQAPKPAQTPADTTTVTVDSSTADTVAADSLGFPDGILEPPGQLLRADAPPRVPTVRGDTAVLVDTLARPDSAWVRDSTGWRLYGRTRSSLITTTTTVRDSMVPFPPPPVRTLAFGMSQMPDEVLGAGMFNATMGGLAPRYLLAELQQASAKGAHWVVVTPRVLLTTNGKIDGLFSQAKANALPDAYLAAVPADSLRKYVADGTLIGMNMGDDYGCLACWGGKGITQAQIDQMGRAFRAKMPYMPLGVRVPPYWLQRDRTIRWSDWLDYAWAQYRPVFKPQPYTAWYDGQIAAAQSIGIKLAGGVNVYNCRLTEHAPCAASDEVAWLSDLIADGDVCAVVSWKYDAFDVKAHKATWTQLAAQAATKPWRSCKR